ncbi:MAG: DUF624 domain-containing protein [Saccharofermentans sp.]|nr:DUF624 domain-containing protein [Saccharofermentans sp.]
MNDFFNKDSFAMRFLTELCNLIIVNILFMLTCIPIVTIGASLSALYRVTFAIHCKEEVTVVRTYFKTFKSSFKQATLLWVPSFIAFAFFIYEILLILFILDPSYKMTQIPVWFMLILILSVWIYSFPMIGLYEQPLKQTLKNSVILAVSNLPVTISTIVVKGGIIFISLKYPTWGVIIGSFFLLFGFGLSSFVTAFFLKKIFEKYGSLSPYDENEPEFMTLDSADYDTDEEGLKEESETEDPWDAL